MRRVGRGFSAEYEVRKGSCKVVIMDTVIIKRYIYGVCIMLRGNPPLLKKPMASIKHHIMHMHLLQSLIVIP